MLFAPLSSSALLFIRAWFNVSFLNHTDMGAGVMGTARSVRVKMFFGKTEVSVHATEATSGQRKCLLPSRSSKIQFNNCIFYPPAQRYFEDFLIDVLRHRLRCDNQVRRATIRLRGTGAHASSIGFGCPQGPPSYVSPLLFVSLARLNVVVRAFASSCMCGLRALIFGLTHYVSCRIFVNDVSGSMAATDARPSLRWIQVISPIQICCPISRMLHMPLPKFIILVFN